MLTLRARALLPKHRSSLRVVHAVCDLWVHNALRRSNAYKLFAICRVKKVESPCVCNSPGKSRSRVVLRAGRGIRCYDSNTFPPVIVTKRRVRVSGRIKAWTFRIGIVPRGYRRQWHFTIILLR